MTLDRLFRAFFLSASILLSVVLAPHSAQAAIVSWTNAAGGNWNVPANWSSNPSVPAATDTVNITLAGTYTVTLNVVATVASINLGGGSGTQTLSIPGNMLTLNGPGVVNGNGVLSQSGGTVTGTGLLTINGVWDWTGGVMSGAGATTVNGTLNLGGTPTKTLTQRTLNNAGTTIWTGSGSLSAGGGSVINNTSLWDAQSNAAIANGGGTASTFNNSGTFRKSGGTGITTMAIFFNNTGTLSILTAGTVVLQSNGTHTGSFSAGTGVIEFAFGAHNMGAGTSLTGTIELATATMNINSALTMSDGIFMQTGGFLQGTAAFTANVPYHWTNGTMAGTGSTTIGAADTLYLEGGNNKTLSERTLNNSGTVVWTEVGDLLMAVGADVNNTGLWDARNNEVLANGGGVAPTFNNSGTFQKTVNTGTTTLGIVFHNTGNLNVLTSGTMLLQVSATHTGSFSAGTGLIEFGSGTHNLNAGTSLTGTIELSATLNINSPLTMDTGIFMHTSGTLQGPAAFTANVPYHWTNGTMAGTGSTTIGVADTLYLSGNSNKTLSQRTLNNPATVVWTEAGDFVVDSGAIVNNTGLWDARNNEVLANGGGVAPTFNNSGTFQKTVNTGTTTLGIVFHNTGNLNVLTSGTMLLQVSATHTGSFSAGTGLIEFGSGTHNLNAGTSLTGAIELSATLNINSPLTMDTGIFMHTSGTLQGPAAFTANVPYHWTNGTMAGTGSTTIGVADTLYLSGNNNKTLSQRTLNNPATVVWTEAGDFVVDSGAIVNNTGLWDARNNEVLANGGGVAPTFNNSGTFQKTVNTGTTTLGIVFHNTGNLNVLTSGTMLLQVSATHTGSFSAGTGLIEFGSGTHNLNAGTSLTGAIELSATLNINSPLTMDTGIFMHTSGTLQGPAAFTANVPYHWTNGTMAGTGSTTIGVADTLYLSGNNNKTLSQRTLNTQGTTLWTESGDFVVDSGAIVNNAGLWDARNNEVLANGGGTAPAFNNSGTFQKSVQTGTTSVGVAYANSGTTQVLSGVLGTTSTYTQTAGATILNGGNMTNSLPLAINGGTVSGFGTITGDVNISGGVMTPGFSPAILNVIGTYAQSAAGAYTVEIGGLTAGTQFDQVNQSGTSEATTLNGTINVGLAGGFVPSVGNSFTIMNCTTRTGTFSTENLGPIPGGLAWDVVYNPTSVVLNVVSTGNSPPVLAAIGNKTVNELTSLAFTATATDPDAGQTIAYSLDAGAPAGATINATTGAFSWTPTEAQGPSTFPVTIRATDNGGPPLSDSEVITITVNEVNVAPVLAAIGNKTTNVGVLLTFTATATDADLPPNALAFSLDAGFPAGAAINTSTGAFSWTPTSGMVGNHGMTVRVTDNGTPPLSGSEAIILTVNPALNQAPVLATIGDKTVNELVTLTFTATATDPDAGQTVAYSLDAGAPAGAAINGTTGAFTWTPTEGQGPGSFPVTIRATDNGTPPLNDFEVITVTVNEVNVAPVVTSPGNRTVNELTALTFMVTATDADLPANTLSWSLDAGAPAGATINASTGAFSWTPTEAQGPGTFPVTIRATDNGTPVLSGTTAITITVNEVNVAPVVTSPGNRTVNELTILAFTVTATDADIPANTLSWSLDAGAPAGATINGSTGAFSWTPTEAQGPGTFPVTIRATDNGTPVLSGTAAITITVNEVNVAPVLGAIGDRTVSELVALAFTATATDADLPANTLTFSLDAGAPAGAAINGTTGAFTWTPTEAQGPGSYPITIRVIDNGAPSLNDFETITVTVNEVNVAPVVTSPGNRTVNELTALTLTVTATDADIPANTLSFSLDAGAPAGATINASTGAFSWTPTEAQGPGTFPVTIRATDNGTPSLSGTAAITITVNEANVAPILVAIGNQAGTVGVPITFTATATDPDIPANTLTFSLDAGAPAGATINASTGAFTWTPSTNGSFPATIRVTDNGAPPLSDFEAITITVSPAPNQPPVLGAIGSKTVNELAALAFTATATDPDAGQTLTLSLDAGVPAGATINASTGAFTWTPTEAQGLGSYPITIRVTDNGAPTLSDFETITVTVNEVNVAPVVASPGNRTVDELTPLNFTVTATDMDVPANTQAWSLDAGAPAGAAINAATGAFSWTPTEAQGPGTYPVTIRATDNGTPALSGTAAITITVNEVNVAPVLGAIGDRTVNELVAVTFTATATDADLPANTLTFSLDAGAPAGATINGTTGAFTWTPTEAQGPGSYPVTVRVTDNGTPALNDFEAIAITVNEVNAAPVLGAIGNKVGTAGVPVTFTATATDPDIPANTLTFTLDAGAPAGAAINGSTGAFSWTPGATGSFAVTVRVTDSGTPALSDFEAITITVGAAPNQAPVLGAIGNKSVNELTTLAFTATATDPDAGQTLTFTLDAGAPAGAAINGVTGAFTWTPTEAQGPGIYPVTVRVTDNGSPARNDFEAITITVNEVNAAPVLGAIGNKSATVGVPVTFTATATDPDIPASTLTFTLDAGVPSGATINASTGAFSWTPGATGTFPVTIRVTDNGTPALSDFETITITVGGGPTNQAPVLGAIGNKTVAELATLAFTATATDPDAGQTVAFSLDAGAPAGATINGAAGSFTWTPTEAQGPGNYPLTVRVTDNGAPALNDFETITVTVSEVNAPPVLAAIGNRTVAVGNQLSFTATATDPDIPGNSLGFSLDPGAPSGATINASTGAFSWTPATSGSYPVVVRVTDNGTPPLSDFETITITVTGEATLSGLSVADTKVIERHEGFVEVKFKVTLSPAGRQRVTVAYTTVDGTANTPSDYVRYSGTLEFFPGHTIQFITVKVTGDRRVEADEIFYVDLSSPVNATITDGRSEGMIANDDFPMVVRPHSACFWQHHLDDVAMYLPQTLGNLVVSTVDQARSVLRKRYNLRDANDRLRAQLLAALLNLANGATATDCIHSTVAAAQSFLTSYGSTQLKRRNNPELYLAAVGLARKLRAYNHGRSDCDIRLASDDDDDDDDLLDPEDRQGLYPEDTLDLYSGDGLAAAAPAATLQPNFPNPFNGDTHIGYRLEASTHARLVVYDVQGREVRVLVDKVQSAGDHGAAWDGTGHDRAPLASGVYFYRLTAGGLTLVGRMILAR